jgi:hypothetical protein
MIIQADYFRAVESLAAVETVLAERSFGFERLPGKPRSHPLAKGGIFDVQTSIKKRKGCMNQAFTVAHGFSRHIFIVKVA